MRRTRIDRGGRHGRRLTTQVIALLLRHGVCLGFLSPSGAYRGQLVSPESGNVFLRLALDLMEVHRVSVIDRLTLAVINRRMLGPEDFEMKGPVGGVRMTRPALRRYLALYEEAMGEVAPGEGTTRGRIQQQVEALRRWVMEGGRDDEGARVAAREVG